MSEKSSIFAPDLENNKFNLLKNKTMSQKQMYDLSCVFDSRESFYSKAKVVISSDKLTLFSYNTEVAEFDRNKNELLVKESEFSKNGKYSATTTRHIREFAQQQGFGKLKSIKVGTYSK